MQGERVIVGQINVKLGVRSEESSCSECNRDLLTQEREGEAHPCL